MIQTYSLEILGTLLTIQIDTIIDCRKEFFEVERRLQCFEEEFSRFKQYNWLDTLNRTGRGSMSTDGENMLKFALELARISDGYFDPTIIDMLESIGYAKRSNMNAGIKPKSPKAYHGGVPFIRKTSFQDIEIHEHECILHNGARIEFGGVGKGYALDIIVQILDHFDRFIINFGGDIALKGGWNLGLEDPDDSESVIGSLFIESGFFCASSGSKRKIGKFHHLLDPLNGGNTTYTKGSYVFANSGILADSFATLACITSLEKTEEIYAKILETPLLNTNGSTATLSFAVLTSDRHVARSDGIFENLIFMTQEE